jgi:hypothetical protein
MGVMQCGGVIQNHNAGTQDSKAGWGVLSAEHIIAEGERAPVEHSGSQAQFCLLMTSRSMPWQGTCWS